MKHTGFLVVLMIAAVALVGAACGSDELAGADLTLDREVVLTYDIPEILQGMSFTVRAYADEVVGEDTRFAVAFANGAGVNQDTCAEAMEMAERRVVELDTTIVGGCTERTTENTDRFHEVLLVDGTGGVTLQLSSEAPLPYKVGVWVNAESEHSGCYALGLVTLGPDQDSLHMAVDDDYLCDGD